MCIIHIEKNVFFIFLNVFNKNVTKRKLENIKEDMKQIGKEMAQPNPNYQKVMRRKSIHYLTDWSN